VFEPENAPVEAYATAVADTIGRAPPSCWAGWGRAGRVLPGAVAAKLHAPALTGGIAVTFDGAELLAIDSDPNAPVFAEADYSLVGDLYEILPALTDAFK